MRNNKRVRFFRRLIYAFIIILLFLPLILTSFLSMRLINRIEGVERRLGELELAAVAIPAATLPVDEPQDLPLEEREPALDDGVPTDLTTPEADDNPDDDPVPEEDEEETDTPAPEAAPEPAPEAPTGLQPAPAPLTGR